MLRDTFIYCFSGPQRSITDSQAQKHETAHKHWLLRFFQIYFLFLYRSQMFNTAKLLKSFVEFRLMKYENLIFTWYRWLRNTLHPSTFIRHIFILKNELYKFIQIIYTARFKAITQSLCKMIMVIQHSCPALWVTVPGKEMSMVNVRPMAQMWPTGHGVEFQKEISLFWLPKL